VSKAERFAARATAAELAERCLGTLREWSRLSTTPGGRRHVEAFLDDDEPGVRAWAAAQVLFWNEPDARRVLEQLSSSDTFPFNFNADMTLREFDAGRLRL
jgi:hypothetical protein